MNYPMRGLSKLATAVVAAFAVAPIFVFAQDAAPVKIGIVTFLSGPAASPHDMAQLAKQPAPARKYRPQHPGYGEDVLPVRYGRKNVFLDPIPIGEHPLPVAARAQVPCLARKCEQVVVPACGAVHARESVVRISAFQKAIDDALFEQPLQAPLGT